MSNNQNYSTGNVVGLTGISAMSLYRYVKIFGEFFSPNVQQHRRGRRWSDKDVLMAQSIQSLYDRRTGEIGIRELLHGGYSLASSPENNPLVLEAFGAVYEVCMLYRQEARKEREEARALAAKLAQLLKNTRDDHETLERIQKAFVDQAREIRQLSNSKKGSFISFGK